MSKRTLLAFGLLLASISSAAAQNTTCSNRPAGDSSNACANTRFVATTLLPYVQGPGTSVIGNIAYWNNTAGTLLGATPAFQTGNPSNAALYSPLAIPSAGAGTYNAMQVGVGTAVAATDVPKPTSRMIQGVVGTTVVPVAETDMTAYGVMGYGQSDSTALSNAIGVGGWGFGNNNASSIWALAGSIHNKPFAASVGLNSNSMIGLEVDVNIWKKAAGVEPTIAQLHGISVTGSGDSTTNQGDGITVGPLNVSTGAKWTNGYNSAAGSATNAFVAGPTASTGINLNSQNIILQGVNGAGAILTYSIFADNGSDLFLKTPLNGNVVLGDSVGNYFATNPAAGGAKVTLSALNGGAAGVITNDTSGNLATLAQLTAIKGGTGFGTYAVGDILYADTTSTLAKLADVATGNVLLSGGVAAAPAWGKVSLTAAISGTLPVANGGTGATVIPAVLQASPANPTGTTSTTVLMMGLGATCTLTTTTRTRVQFTITGSINNNTAGDSAKYQMSYGTGTAPVNTAAATGTAFGSAAVSMITSAGGGAQSIPFTATGIATGLSTSTAYWFDIQLAAITGGTASIQSLGCTAQEL